MKYAPNPKNYHYLFLTTFDSTCFCSLTWLSINALLWLILYFIFYFVVRQGNYFLLPSTQKKWPHFSNKEKRIKIKIYCSNEEHCFHIHRLFFFFRLDIYFIICNYIIFFMLINSIIDIFVQDKYFSFMFYSNLLVNRSANCIPLTRNKTYDTNW